MTARCIDCKHAEWQRSPSGRIKRVAGRCSVQIPQAPVLLCMPSHQHIHKNAIWPDYSGQCDLFQPIDPD